MTLEIYNTKKNLTILGIKLELFLIFNLENLIESCSLILLNIFQKKKNYFGFV